MKKMLMTLGCLLIIITLTACGEKTTESQKVQDSNEPLNLYGTWTQTNSNSETSYQEAVISEDGTITVNWINEDDDTKSLYWAGSFEAPTTSDDTYSWTSTNDKGQTDSALLASGDDTKDFKYENGVISYEASALGSTMTVKLERK